MHSPTNRKTAVLKEIGREFSKFRRRHRGGKGSGYPKALRELALSGLAQGSSPSEVSEAAGVTGESLRNWRRSDRRVPLPGPVRPVELKVVESRGPVPTEIPASREESIALTPPEPIARISLRSGVQMALPVSALSERLIGLLMGGAA
jgi:hypothetical protein